MKITKDLLKTFSPCADLWKNYLDHYSDFEGTELEFLELEKITVSDKLWVLLRTDFIPENDLHEFACKFAESVLHIYEEKYPEDNRPRLAIESKRKWLKKEIDDATRAAVLDAARAAVLDAARAAVLDAAIDATLAAALAAARSSKYFARYAAIDATLAAALAAVDGADARHAWDAWAGRGSLGAARSSAKSAMDAEEKKQIEILRDYFKENNK